MTKTQSLIEARQLLADGWCQGSFARDLNGKPCGVFDKRAVSFDLAGAITRACGSVAEAAPVLALILSCVPSGVPEWNDKATYGEVIACLSETIATVRAMEALT